MATTLTDTSPRPVRTVPVDRRRVLSALWLFLVLNYLYCDVVSLMEPDYVRELVATGELDGGITVTSTFLLGAGALMEIPMAMVLVSRIAPRSWSRWTSVVAGLVMAIVQLGSLFVGTALPHYWFFSVVEVATTVAIVVVAWRWTTPDHSRH